MKIALLQCNSVTGDVAGNQERILEAARQAAREGADLCVTPELALCGVAPGHYLRAVDFAEGCRTALRNLAEALKDGPPLLVGAPVPSVYAVARWYNAHRGAEIIPRNVFDKAPSAELRPGQKDADSIPPYEELDPMLEELLEPAAQGRDKPMSDVCREVRDKLFRAEFKRRQEPLALLVSRVPLGAGWQAPVAGRYRLPLAGPGRSHRAFPLKPGAQWSKTSSQTTQFHQLEDVMAEAPEKNLALDIVRITEAAALASARWLGRGDKEAGDGAAVDAMRISFSTLHIDGMVVIGEGEKDNAPMLYNGEKVGMGDGPRLDVAVDPVEGTNLLAYGRPNAISVVGVAPKGSMFDPGPSDYMQKLVVAREARDVIDLDAPVRVNLDNVAKAMGKSVQDLVVFVLDKPRHQRLIEEIRAAGARIQLQTDGDVAGSLMAVDPRSEVDVMMGTGGTPEGVLAACAIKGMGGQILARLDPQSYVEKEAINETGIDLREVLTVNDLVRSDDCFFAATGISGGDFLRGVRYSARHAVTHSLVLRGKTGTLRYVESYHNMDRLSKFSAVRY